MSTVTGKCNSNPSGVQNPGGVQSVDGHVICETVAKLGKAHTVHRAFTLGMACAAACRRANARVALLLLLLLHASSALPPAPRGGSGAVPVHDDSDVHAAPLADMLREVRALELLTLVDVVLVRGGGGGSSALPSAGDVERHLEALRGDARPVAAPAHGAWAALPVVHRAVYRVVDAPVELGAAVDAALREALLAPPPPAGGRGGGGGGGPFVHPRGIDALLAGSRAARDAAGHVLFVLSPDAGGNASGDGGMHSRIGARPAYWYRAHASGCAAPAWASGHGRVAWVDVGAAPTALGPRFAGPRTAAGVQVRMPVRAFLGRSRACNFDIPHSRICGRRQVWCAFTHLQVPCAAAGDVSASALAAFAHGYATQLLTPPMARFPVPRGGGGGAVSLRVVLMSEGPAGPPPLPPSPRLRFVAAGEGDAWGALLPALRAAAAAAAGVRDASVDVAVARVALAECDECALALERGLRSRAAHVIAGAAQRAVAMQARAREGGRSAPRRC